jgi:hypothetical protein
MRCRTTANLRANATLAFRIPALNARRAAQLFSCLVAEHCWDPVSRAIIMYGHQLERLRSGDLGGREPCSKSIRMPASHLLPARK